MRSFSQGNILSCSWRASWLSQILLVLLPPSAFFSCGDSWWKLLFLHFPEGGGSVTQPGSFSSAPRPACLHPHTLPQLALFPRGSPELAPATIPCVKPPESPFLDLSLVLGT